MENKSSLRKGPPTQPMVEQFRPSLRSPWIAIAIGWGVTLALIVLYLALSTPQWNVHRGALLGTWLALGLAAGYAIARRIRADQRPVTLSTLGIESPNFCGLCKSYAWRDIAAAWIVPHGRGNALLLALAPTVPNASGAWHWSRSQPSLALPTFTATEQDSIIDAVTQHLRRTHASTIDTSALPPEREPIAHVIANAPTPWVTLTWMLLYVLLTVLMLTLDAKALTPSSPTLLDWGGNAASEVQRGQWWRILSSGLVHGGVLHLALTLLGLWSLGRCAERVYGRTPFMTIYLGSALVAGAVSMHFSAQTSVFVGGATSAVFGLLGALLLAAYQYRVGLSALLGRAELGGAGLFVLAAFILGLLPSGLDNAAHVGALLAGAVLAGLLPERHDLIHYQTTIRKRCAAGAASALGLSLLIAALAPPAQSDLLRELTGPATYARGMKSFAEASSLMKKLQEEVQSGQLSPLKFDAQTRSVLAPAFRKSHRHFTHAWLEPGDARNALISEYRILTDLMVELLSMESHVGPDNSTAVPKDPTRAWHLNADIRAAIERIEEIESNIAAAKHSKAQLP